MRSLPCCRRGLICALLSGWMTLVCCPGLALAQSTLVLGEQGALGEQDSSVHTDTTAEEAELQAERRLAAACGLQWGPWMQWLSLALQQVDDDADNDESMVLDETEDTEGIIEISESTLGALEETERLHGISIGEPETVCGDDIAGISIAGISAPNVVESSGLPTLAPVPFKRESSKREPSTRNLRTPRVLREEEDLEPAATAGPVRLSTAEPRVLSGGMKTAATLPPAKTAATEPPAITDATAPPAKYTLKTVDEDLKAYLAQEEPTLSSRAESADAQLQGIDAERAEKPITTSIVESISPPEKISAPSGSLAEKSEAVRAPIVVPEASRSQEQSNPLLARRLQRVQACLDYYAQNPETTTARSPWAVMHALLPYGAEYELIGPTGRVNAIGWMCHNGLCRTQRMFTPRGNSFVPNVGGGVQGHDGQFLAILAQSQVPLDYPIQIGTKKYTVEDLVRYEMATCREKSELTFKLIGLSYYVDSNKQWRANDGRVWSLQKLVQEELAQPIVGSACGGTHRLMGFSFALKQRVLQGQPIIGQYQRAAKFVEENIRYTWQLQNPDGSFSTHWYEGRGNEPNDERKVQTSGHMLEWLMFTVSDAELRSPRAEKAIDFLLSKIYDRREENWPIGPRGHATRALALYNTRMRAISDASAGGSGETDSPAVSASIAPSDRGRNGLVNPNLAPPTATSQPTSASRKPAAGNRTMVPSNPQPAKSATRSNRKVRG